MKKIFVGKLPYRLRDADLQELFGQYGAVASARVMMERDNPSRSRGFGFVEMEDADADKAIAALNGHEVDGFALAVNEARPMEDRPARTGGFGNNRPPRRDFGGNRGGFGGGNRY